MRDDQPAVPLTERILEAIPAPREGLLLGWVLVPWLNLALAEGVVAPGSAGVPVAELLNRVATSFAVLLSLWGVSRIGRDLRSLPPALAEAVEEVDPDVGQLFRSASSTVGPLLLVAAIAVVLPLDEVLRGEPAAGALQAVTWLLIGIPLCTAFWVYVSVQLGLIRLGRGRLTLRGYAGDRSLGMRPVGRLAFTSFWLIVGSVGPLVLTGLSDLPVAAVGIAVLVAAVALFFLSLRDLHRRMTAVRRREIARAQSLYGLAYERLGRAPDLDVLQQEAGVLGAADNLEKRAERIQSWPFDDGTLARVVTIASGAGATILARLLLAPTGL